MSEEHRTDAFRTRPRVALLGLVAVLVLVAAACADDTNSGDADGGDDTEESSGETAGESASSPGAPEVPEECGEVEASPGLAAAEERGEPGADLVEDVTPGEPTVLAEGDGDELIPGGTIEIHYSVLKASDGSAVDSSWELGEPQQGPIDSLPPAFSEGLEGMSVGGRRAIAVPATELYGPEPPPDIGVNAEDTMVIVVDLVSVSEESQQSAAETDEDALAAAEERGAPEMVVPEGTGETEELVVIDEVVGDGAVVCPGAQVVAHYTGITASDGEEFDSSWDRESPSPFGLDQVIPGWGEGLVGMKVGGRRTLVIPKDLAYGDEAAEQGRPEGVLVFTVDVVGVG